MNRCDVRQDDNNNLRAQRRELPLLGWFRRRVMDQEESVPFRDFGGDGKDTMSINFDDEDFVWGYELAVKGLEPSPQRRWMPPANIP